MTLVAILVVITAGVYAAFKLSISGITRLPQIDSTVRPPKYTNALNLLLLGSDTRKGHNAAIGGRDGCACSDTIMLAHISPGHGNVTVVSIPRDTVVPLYECSPWRGLPGQQADLYAVERINATLAAGGPECVRTTLERQTGVYINNVVMLNFIGFQQVINDIGGVNVCLPFAIDNVVTESEGSGLHLQAGRHHINGKVALQFWRTRYNVADGSDIARIARDQYLMAQIVKGVLRTGLLSSPTRIFTVISDVANAMTTDASDTDLLHIATSLRGISSRNVQFITAPWVSYPANPNEVEFAQPEADAVFWALAHDTAVPPASRGRHHQLHAETVKGPMNGPISLGPAGSLLTLVPSQVNVMVLNGSSKTDRTAAAATSLSKRGFNVVGTGYAPAGTHRTSVVEYGRRADLPAARTLRAEFSSAKLKLVHGVTAGTVEVILGSKFTKLAPPKPTSRASIRALSDNYGGINASISCRNSAFYGTTGTAQAQSVHCPCG
ncbi:MAG: LCP family protein [Nocardiopsaceae bacterium]|nr:LCP family protein [Nocardiopsaceae bacterium]